jgi:hypothetical protein
MLCCAPPRALWVSSLGGTWHVTVACEGSARAQAGVLWCMRRRHHIRDVLRVRAETTVRCARLHVVQGEAPFRNVEFLVDLSLRMAGTIVLPRALWRVSAGCDTARDGCMRGGCSSAVWGGTGMVRRLRPKCSIPTECGETRTLALVLQVATRAPGSGCLNCHGRGPVPLVTPR